MKKRTPEQELKLWTKDSVGELTMREILGFRRDDIHAGVSSGEFKRGQCLCPAISPPSQTGSGTQN